MPPVSVLPYTSVAGRRRPASRCATGVASKPPDENSFMRREASIDSSTFAGMRLRNAGLVTQTVWLWRAASVAIVCGSRTIAA